MPWDIQRLYIRLDKETKAEMFGYWALKSSSTITSAMPSPLTPAEHHFGCVGEGPYDWYPLL